MRRDNIRSNILYYKSQIKLFLYNLVQRVIGCKAPTRKKRSTPTLKRYSKATQIPLQG